MAGCIGDASPQGTDSGTPITGVSTPADTPTPPPENVHLEPGEWFETDRGWAITLENVRVQRSIASFGPTHTDVAAEVGVQYAVADVAFRPGDEATTDDWKTTNPEPLGDLHFVTLVDGELNPADGPRRNVVLRSRYGQTNRLGFPVPVEPTPQAVSLGWLASDERSVYWDLGADALAALAHPPEFEVRSFEVPERATPDETLDVAVTVANVGERDGTFIAELGNAAISDQPEIFLDVPQGGTATVHESVTADVPGGDEMRVVLDWGTDRLERSVTIDRTTTDA